MSKQMLTRMGVYLSRPKPLGCAWPSTLNLGGEGGQITPFPSDGRFFVTHRSAQAMCFLMSVLTRVCKPWFSHVGIDSRTQCFTNSCGQSVGPPVGSICSFFESVPTQATNACAHRADWQFNPSLPHGIKYARGTLPRSRTSGR